MPIIRPKKPTTPKAMVEGSMRYNESIEKQSARNERLRKLEENKAFIERSNILEAQQKRSKIQSRYANFSENVKINLLAEVLLDITRSAMQQINESVEGVTLFSEKNIYSATTAIAYQFIRENGSGSGLLYNMTRKPTTMYLESIADLIKKTHRAVLEGLSTNLDQDDGTGDFKMAPQMHNEFKKRSKEIFGREELIESIADRVSASIKDFIQQNAEDKDKIVDALTATKEKIDSLKGASEELKESYARIGRRYVADVREKKHGLFNEMVVAMSKGIMKNETLREAYTDNAHINMARVVSNVATMYTFLETVNSMRLIKIDEAYIADVLKSLENE